MHDEHALLGADADDSLPFSMAGAYADDARALDGGGRPNPVLLPMVAEALGLVLEWGPERIRQRCAVLSADATARLRASDCIELPRRHAPHLFGTRPAGWCGRLGTPAAGRDDAWAKDCAAHLRARGIETTGRLGALRTSVHVYTRASDLPRYVDAVLDFAERTSERII